MSSLLCCSRTCNQTIEEKNNELNNNKIKLSSNLNSKKSTGNNSENIIIDRKIINEIKKTNSSNKYENIIINNNNNIKNNKLIPNLKKNSLSLNEKNIKNNTNNNLKSYFSEDNNNNNFNYKNNDNFIELNNINKILKQKSKSNNNTLQRTKTNNSKSSVNSKKIQLIELIPSNKRNKLKKSNTKDNFFNIDTKNGNKSLNNSLSTIIKKNSNPLKYFYSIKKSSEEEKYDRILKAEKLIVKRINKKDYNNNIVYGKPSSNRNNHFEKMDIISGLFVKNFETNDLYVNFNSNNNNKTFKNLRHKNKNNLFNKSNNINNQKKYKNDNIFDKYCNNCEKIYINLIDNNLQLNKPIKCCFSGNLLSVEIYNYIKKIKFHKKNISIDE
jgi:hypothetical protein